MTHVNEKYQSLKVKSLAHSPMSEKEYAFLYFYEKNVLKYGLSVSEKDIALSQALALMKTF